MSNYYTGQIMMTGFGYAQKNFAQCNGQLLAISQNNALFALLGTVYGGDGVRTFALPDLRSRTPAGGGFNSVDGGWQPPRYALGQIAGAENVSLLATELPSHSHAVGATTAPGEGSSLRSPGTFATASADTNLFYGPATNIVPLAGGPLTPAGSSAPHPNIQPYVAINFNIALYGIFPSRN